MVEFVVKLILSRPSLSKGTRSVKMAQGVADNSRMQPQQSGVDNDAGSVAQKWSTDAMDLFLVCIVRETDGTAAGMK